MLELLFYCLLFYFLTIQNAANVQAELSGFQLLTVTAATDSQFRLLKNLKRNGDIDFWTPPQLRGTTHIMVGPSQTENLTSILNFNRLKWNNQISDIGRIVVEQRNLDRSSKSSSAEMTWTAYHGYKTIVKWLKSLTGNKLVKLSIIGQSFEGRNIFQLKISSGLQNDRNPKPAIFIDSLFHAREWITSAATTWIINEILTNSTKYKSLLAKFDLFFVPVVNPDGYEYSRANTSTRVWRKTRSIRPNSDCYGVDPNRNFDFKFARETDNADPCVDDYRGPFAFSEPECKTIRDAIMAVQAERVVHAYFSIHSYGQVWILPWAYSKSAIAVDYPELLRWGQDSVAAIEKVHGMTYQVGNIATLNGYEAGGSALDWAKFNGIKYVVTIEVRDTGKYGMLLPPNEIIPTAQELWAGIQVINTTLDSLKRTNN